MALNTIYNAIDSKVFEQIKDCERANEVWKRLEDTYEGTPAVKSAKLYILKDKLTSFKIRKRIWCKPTTPYNIGNYESGPQDANPMDRV